MRKGDNSIGFISGHRASSPRLTLACRVKEKKRKKKKETRGREREKKKRAVSLPV